MHFLLLDIWTNKHSKSCWNFNRITILTRISKHYRIRKPGK